MTRGGAAPSHNGTKLFRFLFLEKGTLAFLLLAAPALAAPHVQLRQRRVLSRTHELGVNRLRVGLGFDEDLVERDANPRLAFAVLGAGRQGDRERREEQER